MILARFEYKCRRCGGMDANSETSLERATTCLLAAVLGFIAEYRRVAELYMAALWPVEKPW